MFKVLNLVYFQFGINLNPSENFVVLSMDQGEGFSQQQINEEITLYLILLM